MSERQSRNGSQEVAEGFVAEHDVWAFFALALALSWGVWVPLGLTGGGVDLGYAGAILAVTVGAFGPLVAGAVVTWAAGDSLRAWAGQVLRWRVQPRWYLVALGVPVVLMLVTTAVYAALVNTVDWSVIGRYLPVYLINLPLVFLVFGGQEELGWRGFALPALLERFDPVVSSLVVGAVWAAWHLPMYAAPAVGYAGIPAAGYEGSWSIYLLATLAVSVVYTWLYLNTGRSVLLAMVLHASWNATTPINPSLEALRELPGPALDVQAWVFAAVVWAFAGLLLALYGRDLESGSAGGLLGSDESAPQRA